jgi:hypothetical protein
MLVDQAQDPALRRVDSPVKVDVAIKGEALHTVNATTGKANAATESA